MRLQLTWMVALFFATLQFSFAQEKSISGTVTDESGIPLPGVAILVKGSSKGTQTDFDGNYQISVKEGKTLVFSYMGMKTAERKVEASNTINVVLKVDAQELGDVVVVGYGTGREVGTTIGSVSKITAKDIESRPSANPLDAMQGKVSGLQIYTSSGEPSSLSSIRLHGVGSLGAGSSPLFVLDGIPIDRSTMLSLNPNDFESVTVLKDASATSIYGSRAANGVIYVTTKRGKKGEKGTVTIRTQYGYSSLANKEYFQSMMNTKELTDLWLGLGLYTQKQVDNIYKKYPNTNTEWYKYYYKNVAPIMQGDISFSGGSKSSRYYISGSYLNQDGLAQSSMFKRYTLRSNLSSNVNNWLKVGMNLALGYDTRESNPSTWNSTNLGLALLAQPFYSPYDKDGKEYPDLIPGWNRYNPKYRARMLKDPSNNLRINPSGFIEIRPIKGLTFKSQAGMELYDKRGMFKRMPSYLGSLGDGKTVQDFSRKSTQTLTNTGEYKFNIDNLHHITTLLGQEWIDYDYEYFKGESTGQSDDRLTLLGQGTKNKDVSSAKAEYAFLSYFGRLDYDFDKKYYVDFTLRRDGSSRFGPKNRYANFWAVGAMWKLSKESFVKNLEWLKDLSIKVSYGTSGNSDIGNYNSYALIGTTQYDSSQGFRLATPGNPSLTWEQQRKLTIGLQYNISNVVRGKVDFYNRITSNMLMDVPYPYTSGFSEIKSNVGKFQNIGVDFELDFDIWKQEDNFVTPYININYNKDKVLELFQGKDYWIIPNTGVCYAVGKPVSFFYPIFKGVNPKNGDPEWYVPGDNISINNEDPQKITNKFNTNKLQQNTGINRYPLLTGGFGLKASYSSFTLDADFSFALGKYLIANDAYFFENPTVFPGYNQRKVTSDFWKKPGDIVRFPRKGIQFTQFDSRLIQDASFMRLKNLTFGYIVPKEVVKKSNFFKSMKFYLKMRNFLTITKFEGPDPEIDSNLTLGANPNTKQFTFGAEVSF